MTIPTTLPTSKRRPGAYSEFQFVANAAGLVPLPNRVAIVAEKLATGTATVEQPIQVFSEADGDTKFGVGSYLAILCRKAFAQAQKSGGQPEIWGCPIAEPAGGTKATYTITVTVTTALAGNVVIQLADRLIVVGVSAGDAQNAIATAIDAAIDALATTLPVTSVAAANVVTATFTTKGVSGNDLANLVVSTPTGVTVAIAAGVAGAGAASITNALAALYDKDYNVVAVANHTTTDIATIIADRAASWGFTAQNFKFFAMGCRDSLGTALTLEAAANDFGVLVISAEGCPALPGEMAVAAAVAWMSKEKPNANLDGEELVLGQPLASLVYIDTEVESALNGGVTPLTPGASGSTMKIESLVTTQITFNGAPFEPLRDAAYPRTAAYRAKQISIGFRTRFKQQNKTDDVLKRVRAMVIGIDRTLEELGILRDVESFVDSTLAEFSDSAPGRIVIAGPFRPAGPVHQLDVVNTMYL